MQTLKGIVSSLLAFVFGPESRVSPAHGWLLLTPVRVAHQTLDATRPAPLAGRSTLSR
jgi:hypothetical protein